MSQEQKPARTLTEQEYAAVTNRVLASAPDGMSQSDYQRWIGPAMASAIAEAEGRPEPVNMQSSLRRAVTGAASVLNPLNIAEGVLDATAHPIQTVKDIWGAMGNEATKARGAFSEGRYSEAIGHGAASAIPILGPAAAQTGEQIAEGDIASGIGRGTALAAVSSPSIIRGTVNGARQLVPSGVRNRTAGALERGAADRVAGTMSPEVGLNKTRFGAMATDVAPDLLERGTVGGWSREGLHNRVKSGLEDAQMKLDLAADARLSARSFDTKPILEALRAQRKRWVAETVEATSATRTPQMRVSPILDESGKPITHQELKIEGYGQDVVPSPRAPRVDMLDQMIAEIEALGPTARYEALQKIRQAYDLEAKATYNQVTGADYLKKQEGSKGAADGTAVLREHLAKFDPQTAAANAEYHIYRSADDVLTATAEVQRTRPKVGRKIVARLTATFGGSKVAGAKGAVAGFVLGPTLEAALESGVTTRLQTAKLMKGLAEAIRHGDEAKAFSLSRSIKSLVTRTSMAVGATTPNERRTLTPAVIR